MPSSVTRRRIFPYFRRRGMFAALYFLRCSCPSCPSERIKLRKKKSGMALCNLWTTVAVLSSLACMAHLEITQQDIKKKFTHCNFLSGPSQQQPLPKSCSFENNECSSFTMKKENLLVGPGPTGGPGPPRTSKKKKKNRFEGRILSEMK